MPASTALPVARDNLAACVTFRVFVIARRDKKWRATQFRVANSVEKSKISSSSSFQKWARQATIKAPDAPQMAIGNDIPHRMQSTAI
jgi:hypothetical protein